jgi:predicted nuclease of predicted toxin-antitoxin system
MKFLIDQDVYRLTIEFIKDLGHEVIPVKNVGFATASDETILTYALSNKLILVTRDNDYGQLVFLMRKKHHGVIFLKIDPLYVDIVHDELKRILEKYSKEKFKNSFIVVEPGRHRIRIAKSVDINKN